MAVDPKPGADESGAEQPVVPARPKGGSRLRTPPAVPISVESSLDAFISKANEGRLDVASFDPANREAALRREIEALQTRLADAEARAAVRPSRRWGGTIAAFLIGGVTMFALSLVLPRKRLAETTPARATTTTAPPPAAAPSITHEVADRAVPDPEVGARPPVASPAPTQAVDPVVEAKPAAIADTDKPKTKPAAKRPGAASSPKPPPSTQPAAAKNPADEDLYNPF